MRRLHDHTPRTDSGQETRHHKTSAIASQVKTVRISALGFTLGGVRRGPHTHGYAKRLPRQVIKCPQTRTHLRKSMRGAFVTALSHELRTPLAISLGYSEILQKQILGPLNQDQENALTTILRSSKTLCEVVNDFIAILEIEAGSINFDRQVFDPLGVLEELKISFSAPRENARQLQWNLPAALPLMQTDRGKLSKILARLIDHAINVSDKAVVVTARPKGKQRIEFNVTEAASGRHDAKGGRGSLRCHQRAVDRLHDEGRLFGLYVIRSLTAMLGGTLQTRRSLGQAPSLAVSFRAWI